MTKEEQINELVKKNFSEKHSEPEIINTKVNVKGVDLSVHELMKASYRKGLEQNFENEINELYKFSYNPVFESDGMFGSYYIVVHHFADKPELCYYNGSTIENQEGVLIHPNEVIGAVKVNIPYEAIKALEDWRDMNRREVTLNEVANQIIYNREKTEYEK